MPSRRHGSARGALAGVFAYGYDAAVRRALFVKTMIACVAFGGLAPALAEASGKKKAPPVLTVRELVLRAPPSQGQGAVDRRVRVGLPRGWTGERAPDRRSLRVFGPEGEGKILVAAALHPAELQTYLEELKSAHPSAAPSPPQAMTVPGIRLELGHRATRFVITGREVGEMVMLEKGNTIVLFAAVVEPDAWPPLAEELARVYATLEIVDVAQP